MTRIPLGRAVAVVEPILHQLRATPGVSWAEAAGSLRRGQDQIDDDLELVAAADEAKRVAGRLAAAPIAPRRGEREAERFTLAIDGVEVGVHVRSPKTAGALLLLLTGSHAHLDRLRRLAADRRLTFDADGLQSPDGQRLAASSEVEIYSALGLPFIPPELRNDGEEVDAALAGDLPALVSRSDIRGDLHMHTHWSDGRDSIEDMVAQCAALGYEYLAITDHSTHSAASRNLSIDDVERQGDEIAALRAGHPEMSILHGAEVDIMPDGRLDFPDRVLQQLDLVIASLHNRAGHSSRELFRRYEAAMSHPLVSIVTHPMNRSGPGSRGYDLDPDRLFELAVDTGTVLEIDGAPSHLDLESSLARRAAAAGVTLSIDSDAHRAAMLERNMTLGVLTARRGWVRPSNVLNVRSYAELTAFLARKRRQ